MRAADRGAKCSHIAHARVVLRHDIFANRAARTVDDALLRGFLDEA
jgi:hypothetical protein